MGFGIQYMKPFYVYILTNRLHTVLYIGVTNNINRRLYEHKNSLVEGFTKKYNVKELVYFEEYTDIRDALKREKQLKNWHRDWKFNLIAKNNPEFKDLGNLLK